MRTPAISILFLPGSPAAIFGRIRAIIVDPVNGQPRRAPAHIGEEVCKRIPPAIAHHYAAAAVIFEAFMALSVTAVFHALPNIVLGSLLAVLTAGLAVLQIPFPDLAGMTTGRFTFSKLVSERPFAPSAIALAVPKSGAIWFASVRPDDGPSTKSPPSQIDYFSASRHAKSLPV